MKAQFSEPLSAHLNKNFVRLYSDQTVGEALDSLRRELPAGRIVYFYVVDRDQRLEGVISTRRLILSRAEHRIDDLMEREVTSVPAAATIQDACELFVRHGLLAIPVLDGERHLLGVVNADQFSAQLQRLGTAPVERWLGPLRQFLRIESASGILLLICAAIAIFIANSPWAAAYEAFWQTPFRLAIGGFELNESLRLCINDGLMPLFFFVVGLEIKREMVAGELSERRKAMLPVVAALGGMVLPAILYLALQWGKPAVAGWGIPMATDIAFVVGILALLGPRVPPGLKILLLSLAIADDIGAALVIAVAYSGNLSLPILGGAMVGIVFVGLFRAVGVRRIAVYVVLGILFCFGFLKAGVHPTVAGVVLGLLTPARPWLGDRVPLDLVGDLLNRLRGLEKGSGDRSELHSPLERLEHSLHPWVAFAIMPLFALANAGVELKLSAFWHPVALAVALGLIVGKPAGVLLFSWLSVKSRVSKLPEEIGWKVLLGAGCLAGIGFTMSLFIAGLALQGTRLEDAKTGILLGSTVSGVLGFVLLKAFLKPARNNLP